MKKLMKLALCFLMIFSMCACSSENKHKEKTSATDVEKVLKPYKTEYSDFDEKNNMGTLIIKKGKNYFVVNHKIDCKPKDLLNFVTYYQNNDTHNSITVYDFIMTMDNVDYKEYNKDNKKMLKKFDAFLSKYDLTYDELLMWLKYIAKEDNSSH